MINNFVENDERKHGIGSPYRPIKNEISVTSFSDDLNDKVIDIESDNDNNNSIDSNEKTKIVKNDSQKAEQPVIPINSGTPLKTSQQPKKLPLKQIVLNNYFNFSNEELIKYALILVKDQKCCMYLQEKVTNNKKLAKSLYIALKGKIIDLMYGGFSNYFVQKLIDNLPRKIIEDILKSVISSDSFSILGLDPHGTRVIQKIIDKIANDINLLTILNSVFIPSMHKFACDPNGNHILIKYASAVPFPQNQIVYDFINENIEILAKNKNACSALQKCIEIANISQKSILFSSIAKHARNLISDDFGNYVVQFIIPHCGKNIMEVIVASFFNSIDELSITKSASNVIEKCLIHCNKDLQLAIIKRYANKKSVENLLYNKFGNYVLQTILAVSIEPFTSIIGDIILSYKNGEKKLPKKVLNKIFKGCPKYKNSLVETQDEYKIPFDKKKKKVYSIANNGDNINNSNWNINNNMNHYYNNYKLSNMNSMNHPMNINIAINNYYSNPVYNYYCVQRQPPQINQMPNNMRIYNGKDNRGGYLQIYNSFPFN